MQAVVASVSQKKKERVEGKEDGINDWHVHVCIRQGHASRPLVLRRDHKGISHTGLVILVMLLLKSGVYKPRRSRGAGHGDTQGTADPHGV